MLTVTGRGRERLVHTCVVGTAGLACWQGAVRLRTGEGGDSVRLVSRQLRTPWWQQSWLLAVLVVAGLVLVVWNIWTQTWVTLAGTVLALVSILVGWTSSRRQRRNAVAERRPEA